jgi:murein DD-endopeptidase MepM/ murein hydrolase activator NlpD
MSQPSISTGAAEQFIVNQGARRARHMRVFSKATFLRWPSFNWMSGLLKIAPKSRLFDAASPSIQNGHAEIHHYTSPAHRLFVRYGAFVALLFFIGSFTPSSAYSDSNSYSDMAAAGWDDTVSQSTLMTDQEGYLTKINPQTDSGDRTTVNDFLVHTVIPGETVSTIAEQYGLRTNTILWANSLSNVNTLKVDQKLIVPPADGVYHQVDKSDTVSTIAKSYGISSDSILKQNSLTVDATLATGDEIFIPGGKPLIADVPASTSTIKVGRDTPARIASSGRVQGVAANAAIGGAILPDSTEVPIGDKPFIFPTRGEITQGYHPGHYAFDIANHDRPAIWASGDGVVVKVVSGCADVSYRCGGGYGNHVIIDHGNGLETLYGHMTYSTVQVGEHVKQGQVIGKMGRSGNVRGRTGIHVHFEVRLNGVKVLPSKYY